MKRSSSLTLALLAVLGFGFGPGIAAEAGPADAPIQSPPVFGEEMDVRNHKAGSSSIFKVVSGRLCRNLPSDSNVTSIPTRASSIIASSTNAPAASVGPSSPSVPPERMRMSAACASVRRAALAPPRSPPESIASGAGPPARR